MSNQRLPLLLLLLTGAFCTSWLGAFFFPVTVETWERQVHDQFFRIRYHYAGKMETHPSIIHVDLDDETIRDLSHSFSDKEIFAKVITLLDHAGIAAMAFDMLFPTSDDPQSCQAIVRATERAGRVYYPVILRPSEAGPVGEPAPPPPEDILSDLIWKPVITRPGSPLKADFAFYNFPELDRGARGIGHITAGPDRDGIFRRFPLLILTPLGLIPSMSFRMVCDYLQVPPERIEVAYGHHITLRQARFPDGRVKDIAIPIDEQARIIVNFVGPWDDSYAHYSVSRLLEISRNDDLFDMLIDDIEENLVVISDVSTASRDVGPVPLENFFPLSGLHTNVMNSIITEDFLSNLSTGKAVLVDLILVVLLLLAAARMRGLGFTLAAFFLYLSFLAVSGWLFFSANLLINLVRPSFAVLLAVGMVNISKYMQVDREKSMIRARFENYFAPDLLRKILKDKSRLDCSEKKNLSILFSDIAGFTAWSSNRSADEVLRTLNLYFTEMAGIVFKYKGTIDKYLGDGLLVFFGDPVEYEDHALKAVQAAKEMQQATRRLKAQWEKEGGMPIRIRIGVNSGEVVVGNMGSKERLEYTVIGANVNLAQRLESNAPVDGILVSESVYREVEGAVATRSAGKIRVKGFDEEFEVFEILVNGTADTSGAQGGNPLG